MIDVGQDYSQDIKNDYTAETDDGYVAGPGSNILSLLNK